MLVGGEGSQDGALLPAVEAADTILWSTAGASADSLGNERAYLLLPILVANWGVPQLLPDDLESFAYVSADAAVAREGRERTMAFFPEDVAIEQIDVPYTATDFQPYCLTVRQAEAQAVMTAFNPQQIPTMMQTCNQLGLRDLTWVVPSSVITPRSSTSWTSSGWTTARCSRSTRPPTRAWPPTTRSSVPRSARCRTSSPTSRWRPGWA